MLQTICNDIGKIMLEGCANAGRMMLLFTDTLKRISKADGKETVRQMAKLGADSLPIVMMTILLQVWFFCTDSEGICTFWCFFLSWRYCSHCDGARTGTGLDRCCRCWSYWCSHCCGNRHDESNRANRCIESNGYKSYNLSGCAKIFGNCFNDASADCFANTIGNIGGWLVSHYYAGISTFTYINSIKMFAEPFDMVGGMLKSAVLAVLLLL